MAGDMVFGIQNEQALAESRCYDSGRKVVISNRGNSKIFKSMPRILRYVQWDNPALEFTKPLRTSDGFSTASSSLQVQTKVSLVIKLARGFIVARMARRLLFEARLPELSLLSVLEGMMLTVAILSISCG